MITLNTKYLSTPTQVDAIATTLEKEGFSVATVHEPNPHHEREPEKFAAHDWETGLEYCWLQRVLREFKT